MNETPPTVPSPKITIGEWATALFSFFWVVILSPTQAVTWIVQDTAMLMGSNSPFWGAAAATLAQTLLLLPPLVLAVWFWRSRSPRMSAWLKTLTLAAIFPLFMLPLRFFPASVHPNRATTAAIFQLLGLGTFYLFLRIYKKRCKIPSISPQGGYLPALLLAPLFLAGWWYSGAFGGMWDFVTNVALGLLYGLLLGWFLGHFLFDSLYKNSAGAGWDIAFGTLGVSAVLGVTASSFGYGGQTFLFLFLMPSIAFPLMGALHLGKEASSKNWDTASWLIGIVMASLLALADVDEMTQIAPDLLGQLLIAIAVGVLISRISGITLWAIRKRAPNISLGKTFKISIGAIWLVAFAVTVYKPNAGFHQDHLFVIMEEQADLSAAPDIDDIDKRRQFVYRGLTEHATKSQKDLHLWLDRFYITYEPYYLVNAIEVEGGPLIKFWLENIDGVDRVLHNPVLRPLAPFNEKDDTYYSYLHTPTEPKWNLTMIGADRVWEEFNVRGAGITLGQSDSGVQWDHPELIDGYRGREGNHDYNWLDIWNDETAPYDLGGHGTHTTGTVLGNTVGVAPDAEWFACANLVRNLGSPSKYLECMQFMLAPFPMEGDPFTDGDPNLSADVLNNSWGCPPLEGCDPTSLEDAVEALRAAGIFVVASVGNEGVGGCETVSDPIALYDASFSVGAHDEFGGLAEFSSRGPVSLDGSNRVKPDILAPGVDVFSSWPGDGYTINSGTSMAGPHIAGVVALIWSANPDLIGDIDRTEEILISTTTPYDYKSLPAPECGNVNQHPNNAVGYGLVNAYEAVKMALEE